jgi:hypothetical protein
MLPVCFAEHTAHHLVEHGERSIRFHLSDEDQQTSKPPLIIEAVEVLGGVPPATPGTPRRAEFPETWSAGAGSMNLPRTASTIFIDALVRNTSTSGAVQ